MRSLSACKTVHVYSFHVLFFLKHIGHRSIPDTNSRLETGLVLCSIAAWDEFNNDIIVTANKRCRRVSLKQESHKTIRHKNNSVASSLVSGISFNFFFFFLMILKVLVLFSDGNSEDRRGKIIDTYKLRREEKKMKDTKKIKVAGALISNSDNSKRLQDLKVIVSEPDDAITTEFSTSNVNNIADQLADKVKRLVACKGKSQVQLKFR